MKRKYLFIRILFGTGLFGENGACPPTQDGSIHPFLMREAA